MVSIWPIDKRISRRALLGKAWILPTGLMLPACATDQAGADAKTAATVIYSPAPATTPIHALNVRLAEAAIESSAFSSLDVQAVALPESINDFSGLPPLERRHHWPIVTTIDFDMARAGAGPDWHGYPRVNTDLKFVSSLTDVGFGISMWGVAVTDPEQLRGKRIATPPRPSAVRLMTEVLLRDGWGILDDVELVDMLPPQILAARAAGKIDGTSWNLVGPSVNGHRATVPQSPADPWRFVAVDDAALAKINASHSFHLVQTKLLEDAPALLSLAQGLAVWDETQPAQIGAMLEFIEAKGMTIPGFASTAQQMAAWPGLSAEAVHPVARAFYKSRGIKI